MEMFEDIREPCLPELKNLSCLRQVPSSFSMSYIVLQLITAWSTAFLNLLVIISISHFRQLHSSTNFILLSLAVSDFFVCLVALPSDVLDPIMCWYFGDVFCLLETIFYVILINASILTMLLISVDRYVAICDPLHYSTTMSVKSVSVAVGLCWVCSCLYSIFHHYDNIVDSGWVKPCYGKCLIKGHALQILIDIVFLFIIPITAIIVLYMRVFVVVVSQARAMRSHTTAVTLRPSETVTAKKSELKAARTLGIVVFVFVCCYSPYYILFLTYDRSVNYHLILFFTRLPFFNSCFNPLLYALLYPWFRKCVKLIVTLRILHPGSSGDKVL